MLHMFSNQSAGVASSTVNGRTGCDDAIVASFDASVVANSFSSFRVSSFLSAVATVTHPLCPPVLFLPL